MVYSVDVVAHGLPFSRTVDATSLPYDESR
jgi:hypothetical protein